MTDLDIYYNKFNEDKRLDARRGQVEYITNMKYIKKYLRKESKILDVGAGTGKYAISLFDEGYDVTAIEPVKHNLKRLQEKNSYIKSFLGNALDLSMFESNSFDVILLFGPLYHLKNENDKVKALMEAKRLLKKNGHIIVSYCLNEYALIEYGFIENNITNCINSNMLDNRFHITEFGNKLYSYVRIEDIDLLNEKSGLKRKMIISSDGITNYIRSTLNKMDNETFGHYVDFHLSICERNDMLGFSTHVIDIVCNE